MSALFTRIPVLGTIEILKSKLEEDNTWTTPGHSVLTTYFIYKGQFYKQKHVAAMGSAVSPIVANFYVETFER